MVLLNEDGMLPTKWPIGHVIATYPGRDNIVRVVLVKTATGTFKRPVTKVVPQITWLITYSVVWLTHWTLILSLL